MQPLLSIVIPIYNNEKTLHKMVDSIFVQKFDDWELLLINDGSTDSCAKIIDDYAGEDSRIRAFHKENGGTYSGFNLGIEQAVGKYIVFACADDIFMPNAFEIIVRQANEYDYDIIFMNIDTSTCDNFQNIIFSDIHQNKILSSIKIIGKINVEENWRILIQHNLTSNPINVYKRDIIKKYRFREDVYGADVLMNIAIADEITSMSFDAQFLYRMFIYNTNAENFNVSVGKYYEYEHDMFNEFYINLTNLYTKWNLLDEEIKIGFAESRIYHLKSQQLHNIYAFNNKHTPAENIEILTSYYCDIIFQAANISQTLHEVDELLFNNINSIFQNNSIADDFDNPVVRIIRLLNKHSQIDEVKHELSSALLDYRNPYRIGFETYKTLSANHPQIVNRNLLNYLETERTARKLLYTGNFEQALDTVIQLFESAISTPEQYVILALCGYHLGLTEDSQNAVETGLDIFPNYLRLEELRDKITSDL
ncbi:MAG: glycosyltransferase family 2 protein [Firmicutes bacterium]|nr:glycosyltransferase family 2 protein [Bacillota bacterium]